MVAAAMIAKGAMVDAIRQQSSMRPMGLTPYTKKQLALIERFKQDMGGMMPTHWTSRSAYDIADAAVKAVMEFRPWKRLSSWRTRPHDKTPRKPCRTPQKAMP